jgi:hypothetical protein
MWPERLFQFRLALALGYAHPDILMRQLSVDEYDEWKAYYMIEPFGEEAAYFRNGQLACAIINPQLKKGRTPFKPSDFMPQIEKLKRKLMEPVQVAKIHLDQIMQVFGPLGLKKKRKDAEHG